MPRPALIQKPLSILFAAQMYLAMGVVGLVMLPAALISRDGAIRACKLFCGWVRFTARLMLGIDTRIEGVVPTGPALVAAKHQSFLDVLLIFAALPRPRFVMKAELLRMPVFGWYVRRLGCIPVARGGGAAAVAAMVAAARGEEGQVVIYPQGQRLRPGATAPYKYGTAALYADLGLPCVPVATEAGHVWPLGPWRKAGRATVRFLPALPPGLPPEDLLARLQAVIDPESERLSHEHHRHAG
ncbi:lysophospholipid acyltransferase family protein [Falsirhodobacter halotolerans]|uniref:lysophospholipid acyltransferase family protein n=1 Tax=Falsirhodobacter halotolerans TaxID=1146892 RepID=UPI001FD1FE9C|nr:lysophospholipid acyltransferase family protein [Falsirhodobacter halotolerans]MCJ8140527.1 1-acyl-sn-glycerol-3-phosphate acyltransferase [Falsirhodobacter halotolerans]